MHAETAGNADWTLDEDTCGTAQRFPTPDQSGITSSTPETYWNGALSAMGVDLVKKGFHVESLPVGARISYNDSTNPQDLKNYNVYVVPEPNTRFTTAEVTAIRAFVQNGGGLLMISDHAGADRNNDGWEPPAIFNDLMGSPSLFGITYNANKSDTTYGWFDDHPDVNYTTDTTSPIIYTGPFGSPSPTKGLGLFGSTSMTLTGAAKGHIWRTVATHDTASGVTFATSTYGTGRVAAVGDSSITEDATNGCGHTTYLGYNDPTYDNGLLIANAVYWLANGSGGGGDTTPPTTSIIAPAAGATVSGTVTVSASASDNVGVTKVEFYLDGTLQSTGTTSPYSWSWTSTSATNGSHSLVTKAYDAANNIGTSATVTVTVSNTSGDTTPPTTSITAPTAGATVSGTVTVSASASDNVGVTKVEFYLDGALQSTDTTSPYSWSWTSTSAANGSHSLVTKAYDAANNVGTSATVTVTVSNSGSDTTPPTCSITTPAAGSTVSGTVTITATASDNVGVTKVEIYVDGALRVTDTATPYTWSWNTTTFANSSHTITAKAYDAAGNIGQAANVSVTVNNSGGGSSQLLVNPGFETGTASPWVASSGVVNNSSSEAAHSGSWKAWLDGYGSTHTDTLYQQVAIPSTATSATLTFYLHIDTAETGSTVYDTLKVQIRNSSGTVLTTLATYSNVNAATGFSQKSFNLLAYAGQTVQVYLVGAEDSTQQTSFVVDDFALNVQ